MLNLPGVKEDVGLIGVHFRGQFVELVPWNGAVTWDVAPWGRCAFANKIHMPNSTTSRTFTHHQALLYHCFP